MCFTKKFMLSSCFLLAVFFGCSENPSQVVAKGDISINLVADAQSDFNAVAATAKVEVSAEGMPTLTQPLTVTSGGISGTITGIVAGPGRKFEVFVYDAANKLCYYGSAVGEVTVGGTASISLTLSRVSGEGNATINGTIQSSNTPPTVSITSPANNAQFTVGSSIAIAASAADADGSISSVTFYSGSTLISTDNTSPYTCNYTPSTAGNFTLTAVATDNAGASTTSASVTVTVTPITPQTSYKINCGGSAVSPFTADQYSSGGTQHSVTNTITISGITNPAPAAVYQSERYGAVTYTFPNLTAGVQYTVRLHFAELYQTAVGKRKFNVGINGTSVLSNFDIYSTAGGQYRAVVREFTTTPNSSRQIVINLTTVTDQATINGIEILPMATTYSITYNLNGGTNSPNNPATYSTSGSAMPLYNATRSGYTFDGWYDNAGFTGTAISGIAAGSAGNRSFYAKWVAEAYSITYYLNGGTNSPNNPATYSTSGSAMPLYNATRSGYTFDGWYDNAGFTGTAISGIAAGSSGNRSFYAKWVAEAYSITYYLNGGTNSPNNPATYSTSGSAMPLYNATRSGFTFDGWYDNAGFTGTAISGIAAGSTGNRSFYAKWVAVTYSITYYLDGGTNSSNNPATYSISGSTILLYNPSKMCCSFDGWYSDASFTTPVSGIPAGSTGNKSVWVKWISNAPIISTQPVNTPVRAGDEGTLTCVGPAGATYQWYLASSGAAISGATSSNFTNAPSVTTSYYCIVTNPATGCTTRSNTATFVVFN